MEVLIFFNICWAWLRDMHVVNKVARPTFLEQICFDFDENLNFRA